MHDLGNRDVVLRSHCFELLGCHHSLAARVRGFFRGALDDHTRSPGRRSREETEQWSCWFGRARTIARARERSRDDRPQSVTEISHVGAYAALVEALAH